MIISFSKLWQHGRIGNCFFQIASIIGIAEKNNCKASFPFWPFENYFENKLPDAWNGLNAITEKEKNFHYDEYIFNDDQNRDLIGYFQSEKYFSKAAVKDTFKFKIGFLQEVKNKLPKNGKKNISIHIRRGDYLQEPYCNFYYQLPVTYFIDSLLSIENWQDYNLLFFSDDLDYCKLHFECLINAYFPELNEIETIAAGQFCEHFILSNSTFGWWIAYLGEKENSKVIHPGHYFTGRLAQENDIKDFWPERWIENKKEKYTIDISDLTFTVPVFCDSKDRKKNLDLSVCILQNYFKTNIIIGEQGGDKFRYMSQWCQYIHFQMRYFHRTKMLNQMALKANTPYIANWDCDVIISPMQIYLSVLALRSGAEIVFPYDGRFARWEREPWFKKIEKVLDIGATAGTRPKGNRGADIEGQYSVGGAVFVNKESFIKSGMENEHMISFGPEDCERNDRFTMLGLRIERVKGYLHHINHWCGPDSSIKNPFFKSNHAEIDKIRLMNKEQLQVYIETWPWCKSLK
jgi:hypothetical protein